jgi:membrane-associated phospholipid phosphatase
MNQGTPEVKIPRGWRRIPFWVRRVRPTVWVASLAVGLIAFLAFLPAPMRLIVWRGLQAQGILVGMLLIFGLLAISLLWSTGQRVDAWTFLFVNVRGLHPPWLDWAMLSFTQIGNGVTTIAIALAFLLEGDRILAYELILGTLTLWLVVELIKALVRRSRPFVKLTQTRIVGYRAGGRSFPSGHTSQVFFTAALMIHHFHTVAGAAFLLYGIALLVGVTRIYVGAHYPRDVLAGAILGSVWGVVGVVIDAYILSWITGRP